MNSFLHIDRCHSEKNSNSQISPENFEKLTIPNVEQLSKSSSVFKNLKEPETVSEAQSSPNNLGL